MRKTLLWILLIGLLATPGYLYRRELWGALYQAMHEKQTIASIQAQYGATAEERLLPFFQAAQVAYPPAEIKLLALKEERVLELWALQQGEFRWLKDYPIQAASGVAGPKLREGDKQVPEGKYQIVGLNPNSRFHLSMQLNYPNAFDLRHAKREGRDQPGSDIFIHGKAVSIGCLAMGDAAIEELFLLMSKIGTEHGEVLIAPRDPRVTPLPVKGDLQPQWLPELYTTLNREFNHYRKKNT